MNQKNDTTEYLGPLLTDPSVFAEKRCADASHLFKSP